MIPIVIEKWHEMVKANQFEGFNTLLAQDAVLISPASSVPKVGKEIVYIFLSQYVKNILVNEHFKYVNEWYGNNSAVLEFETVCDGVSVNGIDMVTWNEDNHITQIKVMIRPFKALNKVNELFNLAMERS